MGFMDKVKAATQDVATQAKKATTGAQTKIEESQVKKKMDDSAKQLGYLVYRERTQGTPAGAEADAAVTELQGLEQKLQELQAQAAQQAGPETATPPPGAPADPGAAAGPPPSTPPTSSEPTGGDSKL